MGRTSRARQARDRQEAPAARLPSAEGGWYLADAKRAEQWLRSGQPARAAEAFSAILSRLGDRPGYERAVILERLGCCLHLQGRGEGLAQIREALAITARLPPGNGARALRGVLHSDLGDMLCAQGRLPESRRAYEEALAIARRQGDARAEGIDLIQLGTLAWQEGRAEEALDRCRAAVEALRRAGEGELEALALDRLGRLLHGQGRSDEAEEHLREAVRIQEARGQGPAAARSWKGLAAVQAEAGRIDAAEASLRSALAHLGRGGDARLVAQALHALAHLLEAHTDRLEEARQLAEEALLAVQGADPVAPQAWQLYGLLARIHDGTAVGTEDPTRRAAFQARAEALRRVGDKAPPIVAALARLGPQAGFGRATLLGRLGRCFHLGGRPDLALARLREAVTLAAEAPPDEDVDALLAGLYADLGEVLAAVGDGKGARQAREASDVHRRRDARTNGGPEGHAEAVPSAHGFAFTIRETLDTELVFEPDLLLDGRHETRVFPWTGAPGPLEAGTRPRLSPWTRTCADETGAVRFLLPAGEPAMERREGCVLMRRIVREVAVAGRPDLVWQLVRALDGPRRVEEILAAFPEEARPAAGHLLAALAATGAVDLSGRPVGRWLHAVTKKGVLPGGGLTGDAVLRLATDGDYRAYPDAPRHPVAGATPPRLRAFHDLTRLRRSRRDYRGQPLNRDDFDALLHTACGVTGSLAWQGQETKLRAYPASGALYAVEIYPAVLRVAGLAPAVYHYRAGESVLEAVRPDLDPGDLVSACLPVEREMVAGAAALICLVGRFPRHEKKYGEGGYRMMVAEAGHISQNLILAATALGLAARPFGGVFDDLLNRELGLDGAEEQFLLGVLVGRAGGPAGT